MTKLSTTATKLDLKAVSGSSITGLLYWCLMVGVVTAMGYPAVVCVTPLAWLLALNVGQTCVHRSISITKVMRVREATYAGAILGLGEGLLFTLVMLISFSPFTSSELPFILVSICAMTVGGALLCALLAAAFANSIENKQSDSGA